MTADPRQLALNVILRDGASVHIRALRPDDKARLVDFVARMSPASAYFRFFGTKQRLTPAELAQFTELDFVRNAAIACTLRQGDEEHIVGVGRYAALGESPTPTRAEIAFAVEDRHQGRGIGTILLEHLAPLARQNGITELEAEVLGENNRMIQLFATSGFVVKRSFESGVFHFTLPTAETDKLTQASHLRERQAAAASIRALFEPKSVAVIGASRQAGSIGATLMENLLRDGFQGPLFPVNPRATEIAGLKCYPTLSAIGQSIDLAVIAVPAAAVEAVVMECASVGVKGVVVISAGFAETAGGKTAQTRLVSLVRGSGMRMVGPNCMGLLNTAPGVRLNATFAPARPPAGNISMSSQSGALGIAILDYLERFNIGISTFISVGNRADVSGNDLLAYWAEDPHTDVIVLYLESFGNPRKFARVAPEVARRKPIVAVKSGRSAAGTRAASSHSASLASLDVAADALFEDAGVIRTNTLEQLFDVAALLAMQPLTQGPRVGVVTNAGGPGILLADACEAQGLTLPELEAGTVAALKEFLPAAAGLGNPIDMIATAPPEHYEQTIDLVGSDPNVDAVVVIYVPILATRPEDIALAVARAAGKLPAQKPILSVFLSSQGASELLGSGPRGRIPSFSFPENAAQALAATERYARWRRRPQGNVLKLETARVTGIRAVMDRVLATSPASTWLNAEDLALVLRTAGMDFANGETVQPATPANAITVALKLGFPLVAKAISPTLLHKSDVGGVILNLRSAMDVQTAVENLRENMARAGHELTGVYLQREVRGGIEALVGVTTDPTFGPLIVCGMGGVLVELMKDVAFRLPPVSDTDAEEMLLKLRSEPLLRGYRGTPPCDRAAFIALIQRVSALVDVAPEILEMDLNPVKIMASGRGAVVVDARMRVGKA